MEDYSRAHDDKHFGLFNQIRDSKLKFSDARTWSNIFRYMQCCTLIENYSFKNPQTKNIDILDVGCSTASLYGFITNNYVFHQGVKYIDYTGVDVRQSVLDEAKTQYPEITTVMHDLNAPTKLHERFPDKKFHFVFAQQVLEHVGEEDAFEMLKSIKELLTPDGYLVLSAPNPDKENGKDFILSEAILNSPGFVNGHIYEFTLAEVLNMFNQIGLKVVQHYGCATYETYKDLSDTNIVQHAISSVSKSLSWGFFISLFITAFPEKANNYFLVVQIDDRPKDFEI